MKRFGFTLAFAATAAVLLAVHVAQDCDRNSGCRGWRLVFTATLGIVLSIQADGRDDQSNGCEKDADTKKRTVKHRPDSIASATALATLVPGTVLPGIRFRQNVQEESTATLPVKA